MLYDVNLGTRDYFTYTDAMLHNSLFSEFLKRNGLNVYRKKQDQEFSKDESTRDIVCLDFDFGSRSYDEEFKRLTKLLDGDLNDESRERIENALKKVDRKIDFCLLILTFTESVEFPVTLWNISIHAPNLGINSNLLNKSSVCLFLTESP